MMFADIIRRVHLPHLPSASGIERFGDRLFIIGDDSPLLYQLDLSGNVVRVLSLFETDLFATGRIPKAIKPDFEAMASLVWRGRTLLVILGSGSKSPERDGGFIVDVTVPDEEWRARPVSLTPLYDAMRARADVVGERTLNIEAATTLGDRLLLFQRGNISGIHSIVSVEAESLMHHWLDGQPTPRVEVQDVRLPRRFGIPAGFSGAATCPNPPRVLFTASLEDAPDEVQDGPTVGSLVGWLPTAGVPGAGGRFGDAPEMTLIKENGWIYPGKVESITVLGTGTEAPLQALAVVDDDLGGSEFLLLNLS